MDNKLRAVGASGASFPPPIKKPKRRTLAGVDRERKRRRTTGHGDQSRLKRQTHDALLRYGVAERG